MPVAKKLLIACAAVAAAVLPASAQDYGPYGYGGYGAGFNWDGFYSGVYGGGIPFGDDTSWSAGIFTGVNVQMDSLVFGAEAQLGGDFGDDFSIDALVLGKGGMSLGDALVYGTGGIGLVSGDFGYAIGGGAEYGFTDSMSVRGEALGLGEWGEGLSDFRLTAGVAFHM